MNNQSKEETKDVASKCANSDCEELLDDSGEFYHRWDIGQVEEPICESCWNDETI